MKRIIDLFAPSRPTFSLELMARGEKEGFGAEFITRLQAALPHPPDFVSVTHPLSRLPWMATLRMAELCRAAWSVPVMPHLATRDFSRADAGEVLNELTRRGIYNLLVLRGDSREGETAAGDFRFASDFLRFARREDPTLCLAAAGYPKGHPESVHEPPAFDHHIEKIEAGADFLVTQLCATAAEYNVFRRQLRTRGMHIPILPGIVLPRDHAHLERLARFCCLPAPLHSQGMTTDVSVRFCETGREILASGAPGLHVFTLNDIDAACTFAKICRET